MHAHRRFVIPIAAAAASSVLLTGLAVAVSASNPHRLSFTAVPIHNTDVSKNYEVETDKDIHKSKTLGNDVIVNTIVSGTHTSGYISFAFAGGIINAKFAGDALSGTIKGEITGGDGRYHGLTGTLTATGGSNGRESFTLNYHG